MKNNINMKNFLKFLYNSVSFLKFTFKYRVIGYRRAINLRFGTSDINTFYQIFIRKDYNIEYQNPEVIIDAGANTGLFALWMKKRYPDAKIICIEPDTENFQMLQKNVSHCKNVYCENCGLWYRNVDLKVHDKYNMGKWGIVVEESVGDVTVPAITVNQLLEKYNLSNIDLFKIDIETSEKYLFSENFDTWLPKVKQLIIELHDPLQEGCAQTFFSAVLKSFSKFKFGVRGENIIINNINT
jgi:FkbM family methyltransferase